MRNRRLPRALSDPFRHVPFFRSPEERGDRRPVQSDQRGQQVWPSAAAPFDSGPVNGGETYSHTFRRGEPLRTDCAAPADAYAEQCGECVRPGGAAQRFWASWRWSQGRYSTVSTGTHLQPRSARTTSWAARPTIGYLHRSPHPDSTSVPNLEQAHKTLERGSW